MSPTDCWEETRRLNIARRFGSAMTSKTDSTLFIYRDTYITVKEYYEGRHRCLRAVRLHTVDPACVAKLKSERISEGRLRRGRWFTFAWTRRQSSGAM